jgi:N5-(cytidine 5'-diphosphoramidyl)-L-glutamine hydrolase
MRKRIGLSQRADTVVARGERRDALDQRWAGLLEAAGYLPLPVPNLLADPEGFIGELDLALVILTGGNDLEALAGAKNTAPERDLVEQTLLEAAARRRLPVLGVCRGLQAMVHHGGGTLRRVEGHVATSHPIELVSKGDWPIRAGRVVNSFHEWAVTPGELGPDLVSLAVAPDGTVEAACHRILPQVCVMWHPEREPEDADYIALIHALVGAA